PRARGPVVAQGARDQPEARARQSQSGHVERAVVTSEQDERAFRALTQKITRARGLACDSYKDRCLRRRIAVRMRARGVHTFEEYTRLLDADAHEYDLLLDALTINVTKFFRNVETWRALEPWLDGLWKARRGDVRAWSAGCASGEEPYTVAVALAEAARRLGQPSLFPRARVDATDIDRMSLERTEAAEYAEPAFTEDRKSTRLNSSHDQISYAVFCLKKKKKKKKHNKLINKKKPVNTHSNDVLIR